MLLKIQTDLSNLTHNLSKEHQTKMEIGVLEEITGIIGEGPYRFS